MAYRILTAAALAVALAVPAFADEIRPSGPPIVLQPNAGTAIQSARPLRNVFIANPDIANVQVPEEGNKDILFVFGKAPGKTTLYALDTEGGVALSRIVEVPGPRTVRVMRGPHKETWSEVHSTEPTLADLPAGSSLIIPAGPPR